MNGSDSIKQAAINKAKQVASSVNPTNGNSDKKRRKQEALKPIITTEQQRAALNSGGSPR
jgi:serine/threonine-protein kinase SRPK3